MPKLYDAAIVGAGTMGSQAGLGLARAGLSVLLLDAWAPPHDHGAHHGDTRLYRQVYGEGAPYVPLALEARARWLALERQAGIPLFHPWGVLNLQPEDSPAFRDKTAVARAWNLRAEVLSRDALTRRWPGIQPAAGTVGLFEVDAGVLEAGKAVQAALAGAQAAGATLVTHAPVTQIDGTDPLTLVTPQGAFRARRVLVTAGNRTKGLLPGPALPVTAVRTVVGWFQASGEYEAPGFPPFTYLDTVGQFYGFPSVDGGGLKVGLHGGLPFDPAHDPEPFGARPDDEADLRGFLNRHLPGAAGPLVRGAACQYDSTEDEGFLIGQIPDRPLWYATGFSGHGFKFAPALGHHLARWMIGEDRSPLLAPFGHSVVS